VGPGCVRCITTEKNVKEAVRQLGMQAEVIKVTNVAEFAKKGVTFTPALIVDGQMKISGKIPTIEEIKDILAT
jgi:small redox-active disulfide protein 2